MNDEGYKFVAFDKYCALCKHLDKQDFDEPCNECLYHPVNLYSERPVKFEEKEK